ncbi:MAG TPA: hypothetical protein VNT25_06865, partial [Allosphingosinicella sp.]|nr:hypothetical protein [Allosphingosinicella sp.]
IDTAGVGPVGSLMAIIPNVWLEAPRSTLVICFGAGNTFRTASLLGGEVDAVDLVPALFRRMRHFYNDADEHLAKHRLHAEDGRRVLLKSRRAWDVIIVDATPPLFSAGAVNLYTRELFELAKSRLEPGGILALWLPLPGFEEDYWRILSAYTAVFPHAATWRWGTMGGFLVLGSDRPLERSKAVIAGRLERRTKTVARGLTADMILDHFLLSGPALRERAAKWPPLTDDKPVVEFPLPRFLAGHPLRPDADFLK